MAKAIGFQVPGHRLDLLEQVIALALYTWLVSRMWPEDFSGSGWFPLLLLVSEGLVVLLLLVRRRTALISTDMRDWAIAAGGTFLAMLVTDGAEPIATVPGVILMLLGIATHLAAKLSLRRSFGLVAAHRGLKLNGLYAMVRHPMYSGYVISHIGYLLLGPSWWNLAVYLCVWALLLARIGAEERILGEDPEYRAFQQRVRYRLLPGIY